MFRKVLMLLAIVLVLLAFEVQADVIDSNWVGDYGIWGDANNWEPPKVPDNKELDTFVVKIEGYSNGPDIGLLQSRTVNQLDCYGNETIYLASWKGLPVGSPISVTLTLEDPNGITNHGELALSGLDVAGNVTNAAGAMLELENLEIVGDLYNYARAETAPTKVPCIEINGWCAIEGRLNNTGTIVIDSYCNLWSELNIDNTGEILLYGGECMGDEIVENHSTGTISGFGIFYGDASFHNEGKIFAAGGSLALFSDDGTVINTGIMGNKPNASLYIETAEDVNNNGTIEVNAGGGVTFEPNMVNGSNATINLLGGTLAALTITQTADATFEGQGNVTTANLLIETEGLIRLTGPTNIFGNAQIEPNGTLQISDGTTLITGHATCNNGTIHMIGGRVICQGGLTNNNCNIIWEPGTYTNMADFNLDGKVNFKDFAYFGDTWLWKADWY